jgi:hypothetical protein
MVKSGLRVIKARLATVGQRVIKGRRAIKGRWVTRGRWVNVAQWVKRVSAVIWGQQVNVDRLVDRQ